MVGQAGPKPHRASNGVRERFSFWALHLSFRHSLAITELAEPQHSLTVHCLIFLSSIFSYCNTHSGQRLGLGFGDSGASPKTLNPDGNTGSSGGEGLARDQDSSQPTWGPVDDLPPSHGSSDTRSSVQTMILGPSIHTGAIYEVPPFRRRQRFLYSNYCRQGSTGPSFIDETPTPTFSFNQ